jgi:DNA-binding transcriptional ArsR family regulator
MHELCVVYYGSRIAVRVNPWRNAAMSDPTSGWTFLSNHTHVLVCLAADGDLTLREIAARVGVTERAVQRIVAELEEGGVLERRRDGRRNLYRINTDAPLRHPLEAHCRIGELLAMIVARAPGRPEG